MLAHDYDLYRDVQTFRRIQHPAGTRRLAFHKYVGHYMGNGNHCDTFVGEIRRFSGDRQSILDFYSGFSSSMGNNVVFIENGVFPEEIRQWLMPGHLGDLSAWLDPSDHASEPLYLIFTNGLGFGGESNLDFRCS